MGLIIQKHGMSIPKIHYISVRAEMDESAGDLGEEDRKGLGGICRASMLLYSKNTSYMIYQGRNGRICW